MEWLAADPGLLDDHSTIAMYFDRTAKSFEDMVNFLFSPDVETCIGSWRTPTSPNCAEDSQGGADCVLRVNECMVCKFQI